MNLFPLVSVDPKEIKEFLETTITINKETAGLGLGIVGGSDTYLVRKCSRAFMDFYCINLRLQRSMVVRQCKNNINLSKNGSDFNGTKNFKHKLEKEWRLKRVYFNNLKLPRIQSPRRNLSALCRHVHLKK